MKEFFEGLKDFIYDSIDYFIMIAIVALVVFVIGWRLDVLFAKDTSDMPTPPTVSGDIDNAKDDGKTNNLDKNNSVEDNGTKKDDNTDTTDEDASTKPNDEDPQKEPVAPTPSPAPSQTITINIPEGTLPSGIGTILEKNGLVTSKNDFVLKAQSMNLDRKLKSGTYEILSSSSLEDIVKIIAKQN